MEVIFEINYRVEPGQQLWIEGEISAPMLSNDGEMWSVKIELASGQYCYNYIVKSADEVVRKEEGSGHTVELIDGVALTYRSDSWSEASECRPLDSALFTKAVFRRGNPKNIKVAPNTTILECHCARVEPHQSLAVVGVSKEFGHWDSSKALIMADGEFPLWRAIIPKVETHTEYKFVIVDTLSKEVVAWELCENRILVPQNQVNQSDEPTLSVISCEAPKFNLSPWRGTGVAIPVFSLRSENSMGVGDFEDLKKMVDWAVEREMSVIQILPINDTTMGGTWEDSYPYNANSTIALHPQYLALRSVGEIEDLELKAQFESRAKELNALYKIDYTGVSELKMNYLREVYLTTIASVKRKKSYKEFFATNSWWLEPYALFSHLRDIYETPDFSKWGDEATYDLQLITKYKKSAKEEIEFYYFVQYHLHLQLQDASQYARSRGVALKGDIPIGISRTSVDAWVYPDLFNMGRQAGAPPDPFSDLGQNWGFPTYNWDRMSEDGYRWWRARFEKMAEYFDAYRIDHILGFFRIWEIPMDSIHGLIGQFNPALPYSRSEIEVSGFKFSEQHLQPYISVEMLGGVDVEVYFDRVGDELYKFKEEYDTQRKVFDRVDDVDLRDKLMMFHNEVLFVEDNKREGYYHPRIMGAWSTAYGNLSDEDRKAFDTLHDEFYYRRHNEFWRDSALQKLPTLLSSTDMLVCGEDLGMIPDCVPEVMQREQILSLEIERMPKAMGVSYDDPSRYPYLSVCTCSTHDMATIRGWWQEDRGVVQRYYNEALCLDGGAPEVCSVEIASKIVDRHLKSPAMLTILPWQDWMAVDELLRNSDVEGERINVPANSRHYWRYRMHMSLK